MFKVSNEVNPVESATSATESYTNNEIAEESATVGATESEVNEAHEEEAAAQVEDEAVEDEAVEDETVAVESLFGKKTDVETLVAKVAKTASKKKKVKQLEALEKALDAEIAAFNDAMRVMKNATADFAAKKITSLELKNKIKDVEKTLKTKLKILSIKDFISGKEVSSDDIKKLRDFLIGAKGTIAARKSQLEAAEAAKGKKSDSSKEEEKKDDEEEKEEEATESVNTEAEDEELLASYESYTKKCKACEGADKPLTREEFKIAMCNKDVKKDEDLRTGIMKGLYTRTKLEKMGILKAEEGKCEPSCKKAMTSKDEKKQAATESLCAPESAKMNEKEAVESFTEFLDAMNIDEKAIATEGARKLKTTWKIKHGALRKEATNMKKQASKLVKEKKYDEACTCIEGARKALKEVEKMIDDLTMDDYRSLTPGASEKTDAFENYKDNLRAWAENELEKVHDYEIRIKLKAEGAKKNDTKEKEVVKEEEKKDGEEEKATESVEKDLEDKTVEEALESLLADDTEEKDLEDMTIEEALESLLVDVEEDLEGMTAKEALESILAYNGDEEVATESYADDEDIEFDAATESFVGLDMENLDADLDLEVSLM